MISMSFEQRTRIGFQYVLEALGPCSPYGQAQARRLRPLGPGQEDALRAQLDNVERAMSARSACAAPWARLERLMMEMKDIGRTIDKCGGEMPLDEVELFQLKRLLIQLSEARPLIDQISQSAGGLTGVSLPATATALELLDPEGNRVASFHVSGRYAPALAAARRDKLTVEAALRASQDPQEQARLWAARREAVAREEREEQAVRVMLTARLGPWREAMAACCHALGRLDLILQKAKLALRYGCCKPEIGGDRVELTQMVNPLFADSLAEKGQAFIPISMELGRGVTVITGANMGGKSMALKTVALNVLAVSCGFFAFAQRARVCLFDSLELLCEDLEDSSRGLSTFGGEVVRLECALETARRGFALVLLDELARGTNSHEGAAIARGVARYLGRERVICAMATHYDGVAQVAAAHYQVTGLRHVDLAALGQALENLDGPGGVALIARHMDYRLYRVEGQTALPRDALNICRLLGLRNQVLEQIEDGLEETK